MLAVAFVALSGRAAGPPVPTLEEIRSHVDETLSSIQTVRAEFVLHQAKDPNSPVDLSAIKFRDPPVEWTWIMDGRKRWMEQEPFQAGDSEQWIHGHWAFDGKRYFDAQYATDAPQRMTRLQIMPEKIGLIYFYHPDLWLGLALPPGPDSLTSLLAQTTPHSIDWEQIDGVDCIRIRFAPELSDVVPDQIWAVWLDPDHDWLPRHWIQAKRREGAIEATTFHVDTFRLVDDLLLHRQRWFPVKCSTGGLFRNDFEIRTVTVNDTFPQTQFVIQPDPGTEVVEVTRRNGERSVRVAISGGAPAETKRRQEIVQGAAQKALAEAAHLDARPDPGISPALYGWGFTILCLIAAFVIWLRNR